MRFTSIASVLSLAVLALACTAFSAPTAPSCTPVNTEHLNEQVFEWYSNQENDAKYFQEHKKMPKKYKHGLGTRIIGTVLGGVLCSPCCLANMIETVSEIDTKVPTFCMKTCVKVVWAEQNPASIDGTRTLVLQSLVKALKVWSDVLAENYDIKNQGGLHGITLRMTEIVKELEKVLPECDENAIPKCRISLDNLNDSRDNNYRRKNQIFIEDYITPNLVYLPKF